MAYFAAQKKMSRDKISILFVERVVVRRVRLLFLMASTTELFIMILISCRSIECVNRNDSKGSKVALKMPRLESDLPY